MTDLDIAHLRTWIGRTQESEDVLSARLVGEFRATFAPYLADVGPGAASLALHWCLFPPDAPMARLEPDGHAAKGDFLPPVPLPRRMWAGGVVETLGLLPLGAKVVRRSTIADVTVKEGQSGRLCFIAVDHELSAGEGIAIRERQDIVYREAASAAPQPASAPAAKAPAPSADLKPDLTWTVEASPPLLFRYSAITFNSHRIHYDFPYTTQVEGYAGLVVHGPLQASLLINLAATLGGSPAKRLAYRGLAPVIGGAPVRVNGARKPDGTIECWTEGADGKTGMKGTASW